MTQEFGYDVLIVGTGNAAMSAALAAREFGVKVGILEKAPKEERGGNSMLTGGMRFAFNSIEDLLPLINDPSPQDIQSMADAMPHRTEAELYDELASSMEHGGGQPDPDLLQIHVSESYNTVRWARSKGHDWVPKSQGATNGGNVVSINGGTAGLLEHYYTLLEQDGVPFHYQTAATELLQDEQRRVVGVRALNDHGDVIVHAKAVIMACGGFEGNPEMRARYLGPRWDTVKMRGVPYNTGDGLRMALEIGAMPYGAWSSCHASPNDLNIPSYGLPSLRRSGRLGRRERYSYPYSIMVNIHGKRFVDEGWEKRGLTYHDMGRHILQQPMGTAFQIFDAKARRMDLIDGYDTATGAKAPTLQGLAEQLGIDPQGLAKEVNSFNAAIQPGILDPSPFRTDGKRTEGLDINKSNYSISIEEPPFEGYAVCCGITFTYGGLKVEPDTVQVDHVAGRPIAGLYTAGEMLGGLWQWGYGSGSGIMAGATFGRRAGYAAAKAALGQ